MPTVGKVISVRSRPTRTIVIQPPGDPPPSPVIFNVDVSSDDLIVASAALAGDRDVSVEGTPPTCTGVVASKGG